MQFGFGLNCYFIDMIPAVFCWLRHDVYFGRALDFLLEMYIGASTSLREEFEKRFHTSPIKR